MKLVKIDTNLIKDWNSFHTLFKETFGFPNFYGSNMNAWIDCMSSIDAPDDGMSKITINNGDILVIELLNIKSFKERCPEIYDALIECSAFVNYRLIDVGRNPVISLSFFS